jgi:hypothetical protein
MDSLLFDGEIVLQKMNMKGGWTYALLPEVVTTSRKKFGWTKLNAIIDDYEMNNASLMPIKGGRLFLAVKAEIRKQIKKEEGDTVRIRLYGIKPPDVVTESDFREALADDPTALKQFEAFTRKDQKDWLKWIFEGSNNDAIIMRMAAAINDIAEGRYCTAPEKKKQRIVE